MSATATVIPLRPQSDELVLVVEGDYAARFVGYKRVTIFRTVKVRADFELVDYSTQTRRVIVSRWYRVSIGRDGRIRAGRNSAIVRELSAALGRRVRCDRVPIEALGDVDLLRIRVRTVKRDRDNEPLADVNLYSTVERLLP